MNIYQIYINIEITIVFTDNKYGFTVLTILLLNLPIFFYVNSPILVKVLSPITHFFLIFKYLILEQNHIIYRRKYFQGYDTYASVLFFIII